MSELQSCGSGQDYSDVRVTALLRGDKLSEFSTTALYHSQSGALHVGEHQTWHPQNQRRNGASTLGLRDLKIKVLLSLTACSDWALLTSHSLG